MISARQGYRAATKGTAAASLRHFQLQLVVVAVAAGMTRIPRLQLCEWCSQCIISGHLPATALPSPSAARIATL
ncbi:hypothetical protein OEZ85_013124 [Tetradesmus obliquus]|uniref:Uncharacterized protein n=1 Tax=Tetradesmus obliquus TaxID=3088 RepID=A0ABY8U5A5_TETOB|nr:hypothetical protein OEZ85_013124 [Tetradesmus obliquus]